MQPVENSLFAIAEGLVPLEERAEIRISLAQSETMRHQVYRFRYDVYVKEMGKTALSAADHGYRHLRDALDENARLFVVHEAHQGRENVVATLRVSTIDDLTADSPAQKLVPDIIKDAMALAKTELGLCTEKMSYTGRLMVTSKLRGSMALHRLLAQAYQTALDDGIELDFCICAPALVDLYEHLGYRRLGKNLHDAEAGLRVPMVLVIRDADHLKAVGSPFWRRLRLRPELAAQSQSVINWAAEKYQGHKATVAFNADEDVFWQFLANKMAAAQGGHVTVLEGFSADEQRKILTGGSVLNVAEGEAIITAGEVGKELFVVLDGLAEVRQPETGKPLALVGAGQVFGEVAFIADSRRSADVIAMANTQVLVLSQQYLRKLMKTDADLASRLLLNLSRTLCERLVYANRAAAE